MDVLRTETYVAASRRGLPGEFRRTHQSLVRRRRRIWGVIARLVGGGSAGGTAAVRRTGLLAYTGFSIVLGVALLVWTTAAMPVWTGIDPGLNGTAVDGSGGGLLLWLVFGLIGSARVLRTRDGGTMTFHLPFIGAAMVLGGPTAGAWVAALSTIERRELESQPWYGILANHSVFTVAAVAGGLTTRAVAGLAGPGDGATAFIATIAGALVLATISTGMGACTVMLRDGLTTRAFLDILVGQVGRITALEIALVAVFAFAYLVIGWWAPLVISPFVLLLWDNHPMPPPDELTELLSADGFRRRLDTGLGRLRRGITAGGVLMTMDLDQFKPVNDTYGHGVGDEVLREVGVRLRLQGRRPTDVAGRIGGDEFGLFLPGITDGETAMRRADEVAAAVRQPLATSVGPISVGVSIGVLLLESWGGVPSVPAVLRRADQAMYHAKRAGGGTHLYDPNEPVPFDGT